MEDLEHGLKMIFRKEHLDFSWLILVYQRVLKKKKTRRNFAVSARNTGGHSFQKTSGTPMSYEQLEFASSFASEQCPEGAIFLGGKKPKSQR